MVRYAHAKKGHRFCLTERGLEESRVRAKFNVESPIYKQYQVCVPRTWLVKGYVVEVKE